MLKTLPDDSVQCCITSPPYWGLRDYGHAGQMGLEKTPAEYVAGMVSVFEEVRRVLKPDGVLWINLGDSYAGSGPSGASYPSATTIAREGKAKDGSFSISKTLGDRGLTYAEKKPVPPPGLKPKDLVGIPWRVAFALQEAGWYLRCDVIWSKPNPMPESVTDRPTKAHEYIFLLSKSERYFYNASAISEPSIHAGKVVALGEKSLSRGQDKGMGVSASGNGMADSMTVTATRNRRSVWTIPTRSFSGAHFATFPEEIPTVCIMAGSKPGDTVLDPFSGAGTVGVVCEKLQRRYIGIELNPAYVEMANRRIANVAPLFAEAECR